MNMMEEEYKHFAKTAQRGIRGEAFFKSLVTEHCIPIQIVGNEDIGIDYICQWIVDDRPTKVLFAVQVKTFSSKTAKPKQLGTDDNNGLDEFRISYNKLEIEKRTLKYWQTFSMPVYLFAICDSGSKLTCYYKRFTRHLTVGDLDISTIDFKAKFYRVSEDDMFLAFADSKNKRRGFTRDLFIDYIRCNYYKGLLTYLDPRSMGLRQFPGGENMNIIFGDILKPYLPKVRKVYEQTKAILSPLDSQSTESR